MASLSLHTCTVRRGQMLFNRIHMLLHFSAVLLLLYYRISRFIAGDNLSAAGWALIAVAELIFTFVWVLEQSFRWRLVSRSVSPENIPPELELPGVDVFVCTVDPKKEPTVEVLNSVISALALDYPPEKLAVYLSDDGGAPVTLYATRQAAKFAESWIPFCKKYGLITRSPEAYFSSFSDDERLLRSDEFRAKESQLKVKYEELKENIELFGEDEKTL